jgi:TRAP-type C4-dicarboxylate transport system permease small subunit
MLKLLRKLVDTLAVYEGYFCIVALAGMVLVNIVEIASRNIFAKSFSGVQELTLLLGCWMIFIGAARVYAKGTLLNVDYLISKFRGRALGAMGIFLNLLIVAILLVFLKYGLELRLIQAMRTTEALHIPASWFVTALLVSSVLMMLTAVLKIIDEVTAMRMAGGEK